MARTRSHIAGLSRLLASAPEPVYALDADRTIVYANDACSAWTGLIPETLLGRRCDYQPGYRSDGSADPVHGLCPPPEAFQGQPSTFEAAARGSTGQWQARPADCLPLTDGAAACLGVLVVVHHQTATTPPAPICDESSPPELHQRLRAVLQESFGNTPLSQIVGESPAISQVREQVQLARRVDARVLIVGPPGSGREYIARAIHYRGASSSPLAPLACNLLDAELLESTIASFVASCGELQIERPAALLLLEVDQLPADAQKALAGILSIRELGVRTVATARRSLTELAAHDQFRKDLACALSTLVIQIPPLAQRLADVPLLAQFFLERCNAGGGKQLSGFAAEALDQLVAYPWPENVDELADAIQASYEAAAGPLVQLGDLPERLHAAAGADSHPPRADDTIVLPQFLAEIEKELLQRALQRAKGNKAKAARLVGVTRASFLSRLQRFGIE
jgi:transcriptional regulator with GAF, ATPase, and Fis domain